MPPIPPDLDHLYYYREVDGRGQVVRKDEADTPKLTLDAGKLVLDGSSKVIDVKADYVTDGSGKPVKHSTDGADLDESDPKIAKLLADRQDEALGKGDRNKATEALGEAAGTSFVKKTHPQAEHIEVKDAGPGTFDQMYLDYSSNPPKFILVEAKGGSATNSSSREVDGERVQQGTLAYAKSVWIKERERINSMLTEKKGGDFVLPEAKRDQLRNLVINGNEAFSTNSVKYYEVSQKVNDDGTLGDMVVKEYKL